MIQLRLFKAKEGRSQRPLSVKYNYSTLVSRPRDTGQGVTVRRQLLMFYIDILADISFSLVIVPYHRVSLTIDLIVNL